MVHSWSEEDVKWMRLALKEAALGRGLVEPNPMVGCVAIRDGVLISSGFHRVYGGSHAEVDALQSLDVNSFGDLTIYVTLEPCSHFGKTPPCADFLVARKPKRVVIAMKDPYPEVSGRGIAKLLEAGIEVTVGVLEKEAKELNAPYLKLIAQARPWVIAKWAMTLDGAIATKVGDSKWISNEKSRAKVHQIRGQVDAIVTGIGTVLADDPMLNARLMDGTPPARIAKRVVLDRSLRIDIDSQLVRSASDIPLVVVANSNADSQKRTELEKHNVEVWTLPDSDPRSDKSITTLEFAISRLGEQRATNILIEAGAQVLGAAMDAKSVDQIECFIAPKVVGGHALRPILGNGVSMMSEASLWKTSQVTSLDHDLWLTLVNADSHCL